MEIEKNGKMLKFKTQITLEDFGRALGYYNDLVQMFGNRDGQYTEFVDWLIANDFVESVKS